MLYDRNPLYTLLADKLAVRDYVSARTDQLRIVPLLGVYHKVSDIDFNALPQRFVLKCNHDSGSAVVCLDKDELNVGAAINKLSLALKKNMYYASGNTKILRPLFCARNISTSLPAAIKPDARDAAPPLLPRCRRGD